MRRVVVIVFLLFCVISGLVSDVAIAGIKGAFQAGMGAANISGTPRMTVSYQVLTLNANGLIFPSDWAMILVGYSHGVANEYDAVIGDDKERVEVQSSYADLLIGVYTPLAEHGSAHLGIGVTVGFGALEIKDIGGSNYDYDVKTSAGVVFGAGLSLLIKDTLQGFANVRQRIVNTEMERRDEEIRVYDISNGGTELVVGLSWTFGD